MDASRTRDGSPCPVLFAGNLNDPWVAGIAGSIASERPVHRIDAAGVLPDPPWKVSDPPRAIILHRHHLGAADVDRLTSWRTAAGDAPLDVILCIGPYARYEELERWSTLVDIVVSEAVAGEVLPGRLARRLDGVGRRRTRGDVPPWRIEVAGNDADLGRVLVDACTRAGYRARAVEERMIGDGPSARSPDGAHSHRDRIFTIWEVPVLESGWAHRLEVRRHRTGPVIALAGFADRAFVARARDAGAVASLELPCDLDDLIDVLDRAAAGFSADPRPIAGRIGPPHGLPVPHRKTRNPHNLTVPSRWPDRGETLTISGGRDTE